MLRKIWPIVVSLLLLTGCTSQVNVEDTETFRIVTLAPSLTTILIDLGAKDLIVATDEFSHDLISVDDIATFDIVNPDIERLVSLNPDIIFASDLTMVDLTHLETFGIRVYDLPTPEQLSDIAEEIFLIGQIIERESEAQELVDDFIQELANLQARVPEASAPLTVYFEIMPAPHLFSFGRNVFLDELLQVAGLQNIFSEQIGWLPVDSEVVVAANPDIILTNVDFIDDAIGEIINRNGWQQINATLNNQVFFISNNYTSRPTHNITQALLMIIEAVYE